MSARCSSLLKRCGGPRSALRKRAAIASSGSAKSLQAGAGSAPAWADFADPLEAIAARFRSADRGPPQRFSKDEQRALTALGLGQEVDLHSVRQRYSQLVRKYHPDRNGGDRSQESKLGEVIDAWQLLKQARAFA